MSIPGIDETTPVTSPEATERLQAPASGGESPAHAPSDTEPVDEEQELKEAIARLKQQKEEKKMKRKQKKLMKKKKRSKKSKKRKKESSSR